MKLHEYLNLKMGIVEQYSKVIKKNTLKHWEKFGWLTSVDVGLPKEAGKASMLYGEIKKDEYLIFNRPLLLNNTPKNKIIGYKIEGVSTNLGTYGMGGPGFFGLLLNNSEYLTYAIWGAGAYVLINGRVVECNPSLYNKTRPWTSNFGGDESWDDLTDFISGSTIKNYQLGNELLILLLKKKREEIKVEFVKNDSRLPRKTGRGKNAFSKGVISNYILFQDKNGTLIV